MSLEIKTDGDTSPGSLVKTDAAVPSKYPIAKPATKIPKIKADEPEQADLVEDLLSPPSVKSFAWSIAAHTVLLLILAFWYFAPPMMANKVFDTRLAGSEFGDPAGEQLKGGLGMDTPLAMPEAPAGQALERVESTITTIPVHEITPTASASNRPKSNSAANGGGVNLTNPGQAGNGDGFGVAKFGHGGENINGVEVKVGDPQFTLIWDSRADIDLHVIEPGGYEIFWENKGIASPQGGEIDVDDVDGFGPENINYGAGKGPIGNYRWFVHYYGGLGGMAQQTRWKVRVKHAGNIETFQGKFSAIGQRSQVYSLKVSPDGNAKAAERPENPRDTPSGGKIADAVGSVSTAPMPAAAAPAMTGPRTFAPSGAGFSVSLPGEPKAGRKDWETPLGAAVAQVYSLDMAEGGVSITTLDFPSATIAKADPSKLLDDMSSKAVVEAKGTSPRQAKIALAGSAGREADFAVPETVVAGGGVGKARTYLVGNRILVVSAIGTKAFVEGPDVDAFLKSLKLSDGK
ncbi:MAG: hypothetical protein JWN86_1644 [Planctomycetota bacterium]|nr:hypothetical protein [Planctomycetota bacterium]